MIVIEFTSNYLSEEKRFVRNNKRNLKALKKAINLFIQDPTHPSLNTEKLGGLNIWTIRVDKGNRVYFILKNKQRAVLIDIGKHDKYRKY